MSLLNCDNTAEATTDQRSKQSFGTTVDDKSVKCEYEIPLFNDDDSKETRHIHV